MPIGVDVNSWRAATSATVRVAPRVRLASLGQGRFDFTATAAARLGDNVAFVELRSHGHWVRIRRLRLTDRSIEASSFTAGKEFVLHPAHRSRIRVFMPYPILNGNVSGAYAPVTSNVVTR